jgi:hypothetical protein
MGYLLDVISSDHLFMDRDPAMNGMVDDEAHELPRHEAIASLAISLAFAMCSGVMIGILRGSNRTLGSAAGLSLWCGDDGCGFGQLVSREGIV